MGILTPNNIFYKPDIGAQGATEKGKFDDGLDVADGLIEANKPANNKLSAFAPTTSAELAGVISDETGSGKAVFHNSPTLVAPKLGEAEAVKIDLTGGQIKFPAVAVPSADPKTLDDYEEGEWTIGVGFNHGVAGITYSSFTGYYTRTGNLVTVIGFLALTSKGTSTGIARITGLPFTVINNYAGFAAAAIYFRNISFANQFQGFAFTNTTTINLWEITEIGVRSVLTDVNFSNDSYVIFNCSYRVN